MRKVVFGLLLILAAFSGGAVMNGPGLSWLKAAIKSRLQPPIEANPRIAETVGDSGPPRALPAAPLPPLTLDGPDHRPSPLGVTSEDTKRSDAPPVELAMPDSDPILRLPIPRTGDPAVAPASQGPVSPDGHGDWSELRRRMRDLGVSRYEIEGEPNGRSRFRCLIPLAGRRAVGQQFEAEGDDDFQAADAALRRVALWKATEQASE